MSFVREAQAGSRIDRRTAWHHCGQVGKLADGALRASLDQAERRIEALASELAKSLEPLAC